jgi:hypothetical protein
MSLEDGSARGAGLGHAEVRALLEGLSDSEDGQGSDSGKELHGCVALIEVVGVFIFFERELKRQTARNRSYSYTKQRRRCRC